MLATGLLQLALATGEVRYAVAARALVDAALDAGLDAAGSPFGVPGGADPVLAAQGLAIEADPSDGAHPSGLSAMAAAAHRLYLLTAHPPYRDAATRAMSRVAAAAAQQPISLGAALSAISSLAEPVRQVVVVGESPAARSWYRSGGVATVVSETQAAEFAAEGFELYAGRASAPGVSTAYVCEEFVCRLPVTTESELVSLLL
jgi:uncharacterized protein YyaL (SSP411 family)